MTLRPISAKAALMLDQELMGSGQFSIDQLMELAGLLVALAVFKQYPKSSKPLFLIGPGNNGGDGLVAARHLKLWGYQPAIYYPKRPDKVIYNNLTKQLIDLKIELIDDIDLSNYNLLIDCLFGFSFKPPLRSPFDGVVQLLEKTSIPIVSVDIPSGWDVDIGPIPNQVNINPQMLVSLTAPKPCSTHFNGTHYLGGRFINPTIAKKYDIEHYIDLYKNDDLVVKL